MKFGGTSVRSLVHWQRIASLVRRQVQEGYLPVLVLSALAGVSDELDESITLILQGSDPTSEWHKLKSLHLQFAAELGLKPEDCQSQLSELKRLFRGLALIGEDSPALRAKIFSQGEYLLSCMGHAYLRNRGLKSLWVDACDWLKAESNPSRWAEPDHFLAARCDYSYDAALAQWCMNSGAEVLLTQGFIAQDAQGKVVLLGRGGSDTSASYLAVKLGAERLEIWTDVPGIFTANPNLIPSSRLLLQLGYDEAQELASSGAQVLHPRCIEPIRSAGIPLLIRWSDCPEVKVQTTIGITTSSFPQVKGISAKRGVQVLSMESIGMWHQTGFLADLFAVFKKHHISVDVISTSETNVTVTLDSGVGSSAHAQQNQLSVLLEELRGFCRPKLYSGCVSISLVGRHIRSILHLLAPVMAALEDKKVFVVSQAANDLNFSFTVEEKEADRLLRSLHELLFSQVVTGEVFGPRWHRLTEDRENIEPEGVRRPWWQERRQELLALMSSAAADHTGASVYAYHMPTLTQSVTAFKASPSVDRVFYALKANAHPQIVRWLASQGVGFDCVSLGEMRFLLQQLPDLSADSLLFTPNFAPIDEYREAYGLGATVTLDNLSCLQNHPDVFAGREVMLRLDPGVGRGHHDHVRTAGNRSKFGIGLAEGDAMRRLCQQHGVEIVGLHSHLGSGISAPESWSETAMFLAQWAEDLPSVRILDIGGGFAVPEKPADPPFAVEAFEQALAEFRKVYPRYEIWAEPGRYLVAECGVLLVQVTQIKRKGRKTFVGVSAGMNALLRPALYGAYHHIVNLSRLDAPLRINADVVGPICESGDVLGHSRLLPETEEGDVLLLAGVGAYGRVMSMGYNMRPFPVEKVMT